MISKNISTNLILSQSKYLLELNQHFPFMKLYIQRTNLKITWPTLTFYWQKAKFTLYSLNHFVFLLFLL